MLKFYKEILGNHVHSRRTINKEVIERGPVLTAKQQIHMCKKFTDKEIKEAIFSIINVKSPGPDVYSSGFFKSTWLLISPMVCVAVQDFFTTGIMPSYISATKLVVLPKASHPQSASEFRLISCCNALYKCILKSLCQRIKEALPSLINQYQ